MNFIDMLDRPGGHIVVCLILLVMSGIGMKMSIPKSEDLALMTVGILGRSMIGTILPKGDQTTVRTTVQETVPEAPKTDKKEAS